MRTIWRALCALGILCATSCSSEAVAPAPQHALLLESLSITAEKSDVVATVNGQPILGQCVKRQAEAHGLRHQDALEECIHFELLAQAASQGGYLERPEVQEPAKQELVRQFIRHAYPIQSPSDLPDSLVQELWELSSPRKYNRPELRDIDFCRIPPAKGESPQGPHSQTSLAYLQTLYEQLKGRSDLEQEDLFAACYGPVDASPPRPYELAGVPDLKLRTFSPTPRHKYQKAFQSTIFDGPETEHMVLPPLQTRYGWDLILLTKIYPAKTTTFASVETELRAALFREQVYKEKRAELFQQWYVPQEKAHTIVVHYDNLPVAGVAQQGPDEAKL